MIQYTGVVCVCFGSDKQKFRDESMDEPAGNLHLTGRSRSNKLLLKIFPGGIKDIENEQFFSFLS